MFLVSFTFECTLNWPKLSKLVEIKKCTLKYHLIIDWKEAYFTFFSNRISLRLKLSNVKSFLRANT